jgi:cyclic pyranopterin phosphate synthase
MIYKDRLMAEFTHFDGDGNAHMVDVGSKPATARRAIVKGHVKMDSATLKMICDGTAKKGDVLAVARLAGIMGAKQTAALIPLCHPMGLDHVSIDFDTDNKLPGVIITANCNVTAATGVEMEAMTAVSIAALTIYDMCKAVDRGMVIGAIRLTHKSGGKSGVFDGE